MSKYFSRDCNFFTKKLLISLIKTGHEENPDVIGCSIIQMAKFLLKREKKLPESENASFFLHLASFKM